MLGTGRSLQKQHNSRMLGKASNTAENAHGKLRRIKLVEILKTEEHRLTLGRLSEAGQVRGSSMGIKQLYSVESNQIAVSRDLLHLALEGQLSLPSSGACPRDAFLDFPDFPSSGRPAVGPLFR